MRLRGHERPGEDGAVAGPLAQGRHLDREHGQPVEEIGAEAARVDALREESRLVAETIRTFTRTGCEPPTRSNSCSCRTRSSFGCISGGISPTSSSSNVPPSASSNAPTRRCWAPVKAPLS